MASKEEEMCPINSNCESSAHMPTDPNTESNLSIYVTSPSYNDPKESSVSESAPKQQPEDDSDCSVDMLLRNLKDWNFVEHFKRDPTGFLDEIVERYVHLNNVVMLKSNMSKRAVEQSFSDRQQLMEEQRLTVSLRQELEECQKSLEQSKANCRCLAAESQLFLHELEQTKEQFYAERSEEQLKHNGICNIFKNEIMHSQSVCVGLAADKAKLMEELNYYKGQAKAKAEAGASGEGLSENSPKEKLLCEALKNQLTQYQATIEDLQKQNHKLEKKLATRQQMVAPPPPPPPSDDELQRVIAEKAKLQDELNFYKKQYFEENGKELQKNKELQAELTRLQSNCQDLSAANEKISIELDVYKESFFRDKSKGNEKMKAFCLELQNEIKQNKKAMEKLRLVNEKLTDKVAAMKTMLNRMEVHARSLQLVVDKNENLEQRSRIQARAMELLQSLNSKLRTHCAESQENYRKLEECFKQEQSKQQENIDCGSAAASAPEVSDANTEKLHSMLMKMVQHVDKISTTSPTGGHRLDSSPHSSSSSISMSQIIGRNHLKMNPEQVLEDVFKAFCDLTTDYWVTQKRPMQSVESPMPATGGGPGPGPGPNRRSSNVVK